MPDRRHVIAAAAAAPLLFASGCTDDRGRRGGPASTSGARTVRTALGEILLVCEAEVASWWEPCVEEGAERVARLWGRAPSALRLTVARDDAEFAQSDAALDAVTAGVTTARGVMLSPNLKNSLTRPGCVGVVAHELTHARLGHFGSDRTATWLKEGGAEYTAYRGSGVPLRQLWPVLGRSDAPGVGLGGPPEEKDFVEDAATAYQWAAAYVMYLVDLRGWESVRAFMRERPDRAHAATWVDEETRGAAKEFRPWLAEAIGTQRA